MAKYLLKVEETYRADSETEAAEIINEAKKDGSFVLSKYSSTKRELKQKGEVVDQWMRVTLTKVFTEEKDPTIQVTATYDVEDAFRME